MSKQAKKKDGNVTFIVAGLALIIIVSLIDDFPFAFLNAIQHIISDLTVDIKVHAYIAGLILLMYGLYKRTYR